MIGVDTNLPLTGDYSIVSHSVVVKRLSDNRIVACAKINVAGPLNVISKFDAKKQKGILYVFNSFFFFLIFNEISSI